MNPFFSKSIMSGIALAGLAGAFLSTATPAEAKKTQCQVKYSACNSRCFKVNDNPFPCIQRTCDRQYDNCAAAEGIGGGKGGKGGRAGLVAPVQQSGSVMSGPQTPLDATKIGPLIRSGMTPKENGGIVPSGPVRTSDQSTTSTR